MKKIFVSFAVIGSLLVGGVALAAAPVATSTTQAVPFQGIPQGQNVFYRTGGMMQNGRGMMFGSRHTARNRSDSGPNLLVILVGLISLALTWTFLTLGIIALAHHIKCHKESHKKTEAN